MIIDRLLRLIDAYCSATGLSKARVSTLLFNDGKKIGRLENGADLGTRTAEGAVAWFAERWPSGAIWPADVDRPAPAEELREPF